MLLSPISNAKKKIDIDIQNYLEENVKNATSCSVLIVVIIDHNHYFCHCDAFRQEKQQSCQQNSFSISTNSTVNFRRHDPINTTPVFPAGDPFLTCTHQGGKKILLPL